MLVHCATSCEKVQQQGTNDAQQLDSITSFFNLSAHDIQGNLVDFAKFQGQVTIVVNVASYCGYTDEHYKQLVQLWSQLRDSGKVNILAFPCNQFGAQEPENNNQIFQFSLTKGVDFQMMSKVDVNGPNASLVYKYLKKVAGPTTIGWNFATVSQKVGFCVDSRTYCDNNFLTHSPSTNLLFFVKSTTLLARMARWKRIRVWNPCN